MKSRLRTKALLMVNCFPSVFSWQNQLYPQWLGWTVIVDACFTFNSNLHLFFSFLYTWQHYSGLPRARRARGTEPHTHRILSTFFRLVVTWLTERTYVGTYASTDCTGRVGETIKRKGGVSQACLGKSSSFVYDTHNMVNWQLSKQDSHWPVSHDHITGSCVNSSRWRDLFGSCPLAS